MDRLRLKLFSKNVKYFWQRLFIVYHTATHRSLFSEKTDWINIVFVWVSSKKKIILAYDWMTVSIFIVTLVLILLYFYVPLLSVTVESLESTLFFAHPRLCFFLQNLDVHVHEKVLKFRGDIHFILLNLKIFKKVNSLWHNLCFFVLKPRAMVPKDKMNMNSAWSFFYQ